MRLLIIAQPRTGSTVFSKWLSKELNFKWINEPFNMATHYINDFFNSDDIVVKLIFEKKKGEWFWEKRIETIDKLLSLNWDFIFVLTRDNVLDQAISKTWADEYGVWHELNYKITDEWLVKRDKSIKKRMIEFEEDKKIVKEIKAHQITYEGIYETNSNINDIKDILKIDNFKYTDNLSKEHRYRKSAEYNGDNLFDNSKKNLYIRVI